MDVITLYLRYHDLIEQITEEIETGISEYKKIWRGLNPDEQIASIIVWIQSKINEKIDLYSEGLGFAEAVVSAIDRRGVSDSQEVSFIHYALNADIYHAIKENTGLKRVFDAIYWAQDHEGYFDWSLEDYRTELGAFYRNPKFWKKYSEPLDLAYTTTVFCKVADQEWSYKLINKGDYYPAGRDEYSKEHPDILTVWNLIEKYDQ